MANEEGESEVFPGRGHKKAYVLPSSEESECHLRWVEDLGSFCTWTPEGEPLPREGGVFWPQSPFPDFQLWILHSHASSQKQRDFYKHFCHCRRKKIWFVLPQATQFDQTPTANAL